MSTLHNGEGRLPPTIDDDARLRVRFKLRDAKALLDAIEEHPGRTFGLASQAQIGISQALADFMAAGLEDDR